MMSEEKKAELVPGRLVLIGGYFAESGIGAPTLVTSAQERIEIDELVWADR